MYGISEKAELKKVEAETRGSMKEIRQLLEARGVYTSEVVRPGYPDEEILKAIDEFAVSMVIIPTLDDVPSELNKAASIILEDLKKPIVMVPAS
jgi:nucleotide-binding universal stress UspA family protein